MSPPDAFTLQIRDGKVVDVVAEERSYSTIPLHPRWCACGPASEFHSYPGDGECSCGTCKHHVHCSRCGGVSQIG